MDESPRYKKLWVESGPDGASYRVSTYARQNREGVLPLVDNPTLQTVENHLNVFGVLPTTPILDIGCGWGRWLELLYPKYNVWGCDVSQDMLDKVAPALRSRAFLLDITREPDASLQNKWRLGLVRGVLHYLMEPDGLLRQAAKTLDYMIRDAIIVYEYPEVCLELSRMPYRKFHFSPIMRKEE